MWSSSSEKDSLNLDDSASLDDPSLPRSEFVYRKLREAIRDGSLTAGERMREIDLAKQLGVSRTPVREALGRLEGENLVTLDATRGMIVTRISIEEVHELYAMREILEGAAAALAARFATPVELAMLREIANRDETLLDNVADLVSNNRLFHQTLHRSGHNRYLLKTLNSIHGSIDLLGPTSLTIDGRAPAAEREHQALVAAIERRDSRAAEEMARSHVRASLQARLKRMGQ